MLTRNKLKLVRSVLTYSFPTLFSGFASFLFFIPLTTYYLTPENFGEIALVALFVTPIDVLSSSSSYWIYSKYYSQTNEKKIVTSNLLLFDFVCRVFWVALFLSVYPSIWSYYCSRDLSQFNFLIKLRIIQSAFTPFGATASFLLIFSESPQKHSFLEIVQTLTAIFISTILLVFSSQKVEAYFLAQAISGFCSSFISLYSIWSQMVLSISGKWQRVILSNYLSFLPSSLLEFILNQLDRYAVQNYMGLEPLGVYSHSQSYKVALQNAAKSFSRTIVPKIAKSNDFASDTVSSTVSSVLVAFSIIGLVFSFFSFEILNIVTHGRLVKVALLVQLWFFIPFTSLYSLYYTQYLISKKEQIFLSLSNTVLAIIFIPLFFVAAQHGGLFTFTLLVLSYNLAVQFARVAYAKLLGCPRIADRLFWLLLILLVFIDGVIYAYKPCLFNKMFFFFLTLCALVRQLHKEFSHVSEY